MMIFDLCESIAVLLAPVASPEEQCGDPDDALGAVLEERRAAAERLSTIWQGTGEDPLLVALSEAQWRRRQADREVRRLLAFGREFVRPRPYALEALARASGLSDSGVKSAYKTCHVAEVAAALGHSPIPRRADGSLPPSGRAAEPTAGARESVRYQRLAEHLRIQIQTGALPQGARLPSVRELMAEHGAGVSTVRAALQLLTDEHLIHSVQGVGTFVGPLPSLSGGVAEVSQ